MPIDLRKYKNVVLVFVLFVFLLSLRFFDYVGLDETFYGRFSNAIVLLLIVFCFIIRKPKVIPGQYWFLGILLVPILSFLPCWLENGQNPISSLRAYLGTGVALVYFLIHGAKVRESDLAKGITILALIRIAILVIQQFTYPDYLFTFRPEGMNASGLFSKIEVRNGIYRFAIDDTILSMFLVFYYINRYIKSGAPIHLILFLIGIVGVYLDQTRQFMLSTAVAVCIVLLFSSRMKYKWAVICILCVTAAVALLNATVLFEDMLLMTENDLTADNIRLLTYATYLFEFWGGPLSIIFGNGPVAHDSAYGDQVAYMYENMKMFHSDVGIVGAANLYGVVTVLFLIAFYVFFVFRNWKKIPMHVKMYYIATLVNMPMICIYTQGRHYMVFFALMLFFADRSIRRYDYIQMMRCRA